MTRQDVKLYQMLTWDKVSSSSESSSESEDSSSPWPQESKQTRSKNNASGSAVEHQSGSGQTSPPAQYEMQKPKDPEQTFEEFYLKQATKEFANDIDKLRSAPDFNERHVPILVQALKQGTACFSKEEKQRIGGEAG